MNGSILNSGEDNTVSVDERLDIEFDAWMSDDTRISGAYNHPLHGKTKVLVERVAQPNPLLAELEPHPHLSTFLYCAATPDATFLAFEDYPFSLSEMLN